MFGERNCKDFQRWKAKAWGTKIALHPDPFQTVANPCQVKQFESNITHQCRTGGADQIMFGQSLLMMHFGLTAAV